MLQGAAFKFIYIGYSGLLLNFLSVCFLSLNAVLGPTLTPCKTHYKQTNKQTKTITNVCSQHILIFLFRIENNTWVHIDMDFLLPGLVILLKHFSLFYIVKEFSLPLRI